jgi:HEAT repeat protein
VVPRADHTSELLARHSGWQFDLQSALIGALVAWIIAGLLYSQRAALAELARTLIAPIKAWRRRARASQEEKYLRALKRALRPSLLLAPRDPDVVFIPPVFQTFALLPKTIAEVGQAAWSVTVSHDALLDGHPKVVIAGSQGSGRTTSLLMTLWHTIQQTAGEDERLYTHMPIWIDLRHVEKLSQDADAAPLQKIAELATAFLPDVLPKWLLRHLKNEPVLLLLDNWEALTVEQQATVARWIAEADEEITDAIWMVAAATSGYGELIEVGFMPAELFQTLDAACIPQLIQGWRSEVGAVGDTNGPQILDGEADDAAPDGHADSAASEEDTQEVLRSAIDGGCPLWELHLRIVLNLETGALPTRQAAVLDRFIESRLSRVDLGKGAEDWAAQSLEIAKKALIALAVTQRIEGRTISNQVVRDTVKAYLPPKDERPRRLESGIRKVLAESGLLQQGSKSWSIAHAILADFLTAEHLAAQDEGAQRVQAHLTDPTWLILSEFYAGLTDAGELARELLTSGTHEGNLSALLRAARWAVVADPQQTWRKELLKALAQTFMEDDLPWSLRLDVGRALSAIAGEGARAFFLRMMHHASDEVRAAAIRGLGRSGTEEELPLLAAALNDAAPIVQSSGVDALRDAGSAEACVFLEERWSQVDETLMIRIAEALASMPAGWSALEEGTQHPDLLVRRAAAHGLGLIAEPWAEEALLEISREDTEWLVRSAADSALQTREERAERRTCIAAPPKIDQMDWLIAWAARQGMGLGVGEAARETLLRAAQEGNVDAKVLSALTLAQIGRRSDIPLLEVLAREPILDVQTAADWALAQIRQRYERLPQATEPEVAEPDL